MKAKTALPHKLGPNRKELAAKPRKTQAKNFKQSRDVREDRGQRRMKTATAARSTRG